MLTRSELEEMLASTETYRGERTKSTTDKERLMAEEEDKIIFYTTDDGKSQVSLLSRDGRVWLNQKQMAELLR